MAIQVLNISVVSFPEKGGEMSATMAVLYPMEDVNSPKFVRKCTGRTTEVPYNKQALAVNVQLANKLIDTSAFVSGAEYEPTFSFNESTMENEVTKLVPVDPETRKHFEASGIK